MRASDIAVISFIGSSAQSNLGIVMGKVAGAINQLTAD